MNNDPRKGWVRVRDIPDPKDPPFIIEQMVHEGPTVMYGRPEAGKTTLSLSFASALMTGKTWFDYAVRETRNVAYLGLDPSQTNKIKRWIRDAYPELDDMPFTSHKPGNEELDWVNLSTELVSMDIDYVLIDNLYRLMPRGTSVRDDDSVGIVVDNIQKLLNRDIGVMLLHHAGKPGEDGQPKSTPVGSTEIEAWGVHFLRIEHKKIVGSSEFERKLISYGNDATVGEIERGFSIGNGGVTLTDRAPTLLDRLIAGQPWGKMTQTAIAQQLGTDQPSVSRALKSGKRRLSEGRIIKV